MTKALEAALKEVSKLPEADQDAPAEAILAEIRCEKAWETAFASPRSCAAPDKRIQQTVEPVTFVAGQRPRRSAPQLTLECWAARRDRVSCPG